MSPALLAQQGICGRRAVTRSLLHATALVGGSVNARPLLFLHGFPDHPPTAVPFLEHLAETHRVVAPWLRGYAPSPIVGPYAADALALIDRLWRAWSPNFTLDSAHRDELHACLKRSLPAPLESYRAIVRPLTTFVDRVRKAEAHIATPLLQLHGSDDGCIVPPTDEDRRWFDARVLEVVPNLGHFLHVEAPATIAARVARWLA